MSAGTLTLTNNSDAVTGAGTTFTTDLTAGDFIVAVVGGVTYSLPVKAVTSNTALVLAAAYDGPTQSKLAWSAVPFNTMNRVTAGMVSQSAAAIRGLNLDKQNWQSVFSASGDIAVTLPDGSVFKGPSWPSVIAQSANFGALGIGGTGTELASLDWQTFDFVPGSRFYVRVQAMSNAPSDIIFPTNGVLQVIIDVIGYDGTNTRHIGVWFSTVSGEYKRYEVRLSGANNARTFKSRLIWTNETAAAMGIGGYSLSTSNFDWQTATFEQGSNVNVNCSNWLNAPPGLPTASIAMIEAVAVHNADTANRRYVLRVSQIVQGASRRMWDVVGYGLPNLRTWTVDEYATFSTPAAGRSKLGFNDLGIGALTPLTTGFDWQTADFLSSQNILVNGTTQINSPIVSTRLSVTVLAAQSVYAFLFVTEQPLDAVRSGRCWTVYIGKLNEPGSRTFTVFSEAQLNTAQDWTSPQSFNNGLYMRKTGGAQTFWQLYHDALPATTLGSQWTYNISNTDGSAYFMKGFANESTTGRVFINMPTSGGTLALQGSSGREYKHAVADADLNTAADRIRSLRMVNFIYDNDEQERERFGVIAEEAELTCPQYVKHSLIPDKYQVDDDGELILDDQGNEQILSYKDYPTIDSNPIVMDLLGMVKLLDSKVAALSEELEKLKN